MFAALALSLALAAAPDGEPAAFDAQARLTEALDQVRAEAYRRDAVDWATVETRLRNEAALAADDADMLRVYARLLDALGDGHSFVQADPVLIEEYKTRHGEAFDAFRVYKPQTSTFRSRQDLEARSLALPGGKSAEMVVTPKVFGGGQNGVRYATTLFSQVADASDRACGYVVDLRGNLGGNIWHMRAGLSALLGQTQLNADPYARFEDGAFVVNEGEYADMTMTAAEGWRAIPGLVHAPVAVLIDDAVASSGEGVAIDFKGRPNTRFFGQKTLGAASVNNGYMLSDGTNLVLTIGMMKDRDGRTYPDGISPDEAVAYGEGDAADPHDAQVEAAKRWLATQAACQA